jgi:NADH-quinone oxidoreductase subunit N
MMSCLLGEIGNWTPVAGDFFPYAPELAWVGVLCLLMIAPLIIGRNAKTTATLALIGIAVIAWFTWQVAGTVAAEPTSRLSPPGEGQIATGILIADNLSIFFKMVLLVFLVGVTALWWVGSSEKERNGPEFFVLLLASGLGMALMVSTQNLLMIVVAIEFASLPSYALVGFDKTNRRSAEASLKYMMFGAISAAVMLYGVSLLYGYFDTLNIAQIAAGLGEKLTGPDAVVIGFGLFCFFVGIAFKISAVPFHFWCPDAFQGAKIEVTTWLSVASKAAGLLLLLRIVHVVSTAGHTGTLTALAWVIGIFAAVTCTYGNFAAYLQTSVTRLLAYSSIAHAGYMLMAAAIFVHPSEMESFPAISAVLAYVVIYMFMNLGAFGVTALVRWEHDGDDSLRAFSGLARRNLALAVPMIFCLVSLVGLPPFAGFVAKYYLISALGEAGTGLCWALVVVAVINTLISLWYYMRVVVVMTLRDEGKPAFEAPAGGALLVNICGALLLVLLVLAQPLKARTDRFAQNLFESTPVAQESEPALAAQTPFDGSSTHGQ